MRIGADDVGFLAGLNVAAGHVTSELVASDQGRSHVTPERALLELAS